MDDIVARVSHAVSELDRTTQQNAALVEESSAAAEAASIRRILYRFICRRYPNTTEGSTEPEP